MFQYCFSLVAKYLAACLAHVICSPVHFLFSLLMQLPTVIIMRDRGEQMLFTVKQDLSPVDFS